MAPKKVVAASKDKEEAPAAATETKATKAPKPTKMKTLGHPTTLAMVVEALKKDSERKGTSVHAIRTRILAAHPTVDPMRLKFLLRAALNKGIEKGVLVRPPNSSATGATGRFKLGKPLPNTKEGGSSTESENMDPNTPPKEKPKKKVVKKAMSTESKGEKAEAATKKEKSTEEKPKASKLKKDAEEQPKGPAAVKKPKAKKVDGDTKPKAKKVDGDTKPKAKKVDGDTKTKKAPAKKEKAETAEEGTTKALKDSEENGTAKTSKKGKK